MMIASSGSIPFLREQMGDNAFGITTIPGSDLAGLYNISLSGIYAGIGANCGYPDEAWQFLLFLAGQSSLICETLKAVPGVVSDIIPGDFVRDDPFYSKAHDIFVSSEVVENFSAKPDAGKYENIFLEEVRFFFENNRTAQETVTAIQRRWDGISSYY